MSLNTKYDIRKEEERLEIYHNQIAELDSELQRRQNIHDKEVADIKVCIKETEKLIKELKAKEPKEKKENG